MVNWNAEADAKLLVAILKTAKMKIDHDAVAAYMDIGVSGYAVQHRLRKLNALAKGLGSSASASNTPVKANGKAYSDPDTPTPSPRKRAPSNGTKPETPRKRRAPAGDDVEDEGISTKKVKEDRKNDCA